MKGEMKMENSYKKALERKRARDREMDQCQQEVDRYSSALDSAMKVMSDDCKRIAGFCERSQCEIEKIHKQFEKETELRKKDYIFLFAAAAIQTVRWILLPKMDFDFSQNVNRMTSAEGGRLEQNAIREYLQKESFTNEQIAKLMEHSHVNNYTWEKLLISPVPYDAMKGSARINIPGISEIGKNLYGKNHHSATLGHHPVIGWVVGPLNITARMITFSNLETYHVKQIENTFEQVITYRASFGKMLQKSIGAWRDDSKKLFVSVAKHGMHMQSDKYTKMGLPIPMLNAKVSQNLMEKGWNSYEVEQIMGKVVKNIGIMGAQYILAALIDHLIKALHLLCYDEVEDGTIGSYEYKTQKIVCYSTAMAEIMNGIYVASTGDIGKLDVGGYLNFARKLICNSQLKAQVESEFLEKELKNNLYGDEYYFAEVE